MIKFKGGHSEKIPTPTIDKEPEFKKQVEAILKAQSHQKDDWASLIEDAKAKGLKGPW